MRWMQYSAWSGGSSLLNSSGMMYGCNYFTQLESTPNSSDQENSHLVGGKNSEGVDDLFGSIGVGGFPSHEVKEGIEVHKTSRVRINSSQDALEVNFTLKLFR
jgi:hypothetical protein